ncbi:uroporphyrinogen-III synthase [Buchnera aphidicola]|uniref:uroporphyrinogen-III synthase n=1 Tax=Buchnera aphidicola TaxID=9 RepID=UPI00209BFE0D|nr:uroporphyrinogen-III synthase [Buchnera aphidicola]
MLNILYKKLLKTDIITLLQGENGRKLVEKNLIKNNFNVATIECYKRILKKLDINKEVKKWYSYKINTLVVTSSEVLYHMQNTIFIFNKTHWLLKCKIFVVSIRLFKIAKQLGWKNIIVSNFANNDCLIKIIKRELFNP